MLPPERKGTAAVGTGLKATASGEYKVTRTPKTGVFVHRAETENIVGNSTSFGDPLINDYLEAVHLLTQNRDPGGQDGTSNSAASNVAAPKGAQTTSGDAASSDPEDASGTEPGTPADTEVAGANAERIPEYRDFYSEGDPETPANLISSDSSAGEIPAIKPSNFGRDPGGPEDKTLYLTIPELGLTDVPVFDTVSEEKLREGAVHIVTKRVVVGADSVEVMNPVEGESLVMLQTCTLPDYEKRLIVQGELVERNA